MGGIKLLSLQSEYLNKIDVFISKNKEQIIEDLRKLVVIPSVRTDALPHAPYGKACADALYKSVELFEENGFPGRVDKSVKYAVSTYQRGEKTIGLFAHCDVVPADGEWLYGEPFELTHRDGFLIGRGSNDDKSGIIQMLYAAKIIKELGLPLKSSLLFFIGACEEDGMEDMIEFKKNEPIPDVSLIPDGVYPYICAEKSRITLLLESNQTLENITQISGGTTYNVILEKLNLEYTDGNLETVRGISGHAANPDGSDNALIKFARDAQSNSHLSKKDKELFYNISCLFEDNYGTGFGIYNDDEFFGKLTCANGIVSTNSGKLRISLDIRHSPSVAGDKIISAIRHKTGDMWKIIDSHTSTGYIIPDSNPYAIAIKNAYRKLSGIQDAEPIKANGGTYSKHLVNSFSIGTDMYAHSPKFNFPEGHGSEHSPDEAISIDGFFESIKTLIIFILELDLLLYNMP